MNKEKLIKTLLYHELNQFRFSVWATYNSEDNLEFALCLSGSKPEGYEIHLCDIGSSTFVEYTYEYIDLIINEAIDNYYKSI